MGFENRVVLITGAAVGIGRETACAFAREKAFVIVNYSKSEAEAAETLTQVRALGGDGMLARADVSSEADVKRMFETVGPIRGGIDILVNNAGVTNFIPFKDLEAANDAVWTRLYDVNVKGAFFCSREAAKWMKSRKSPCIINFSSQSGMRPMGSSIPYSVAKAAVIQLTECLAVTLAPDIRVNCIAPGLVKTDFAKALWDNPEYLDKRLQSAPLRRIGEPDDIGGIAVMLAGKAGAFITGQTIIADAGVTIGS